MQRNLPVFQKARLSGAFSVLPQLQTHGAPNQSVPQAVYTRRCCALVSLQLTTAERGQCSRTGHHGPGGRAGRMTHIPPWQALDHYLPTDLGPDYNLHHPYTCALSHSASYAAAKGIFKT